MKTKIKRHSRAVLSVALAVCMLISCMTVGIIATDAANSINSIGDPEGLSVDISDAADKNNADDTADTDSSSEGSADSAANRAVPSKSDDAPLGASDDDEAVGANYYLLVGIGNDQNDPITWNKYIMSSTQSFTVTPDSLNLSSFSANTNYFVGISSSTSYTNMWSQNKDSAVGSVTGDDVFEGTSKNEFNRDGKTFYFAHFSLKTNLVSSVTVSASIDSNEKTTYSFKGNEQGVENWTVVGDNTDLFGTAWAPTATANDMTSTDSGATYTWTKKNVTLAAGKIEYKVAKDHSWTTTYPQDNAKQTVSQAGDYDVTITYTSSPKNLTMTLTPIIKSTLSVKSDIANAEVKATYNGVTIVEGGSIPNVPKGASISISVTTGHEHKCDSVTGTYNTSSTVSATRSGSVWVMEMPNAATEISAAISSVTLQTIYFNNMYTGYSLINAYAKYDDGDEPLGIYPGKNMTKLPNSNIWSISVPDNVDSIIFTGDNGYNTELMTIPWTTYTNPKYTAPLGHNDAPTIANGGTWGEYTARTNEYTVTDGPTMNNANLFTGISATLYDYFVDNEVGGNWLSDIGKNSSTGDYNCSGTNDPFRTKLNKALSDYASNTVAPKYGITYPLYWGNNKESNKGDLYNFSQRVNNSDGLTSSNTAITGLSGKTLASSSIHHYDSEDDKQNGAPYSR